MENLIDLIESLGYLIKKYDRRQRAASNVLFVKTHHNSLRAHKAEERRSHGDQCTIIFLGGWMDAGVHAQ